MGLATESRPGPLTGRRLWLVLLALTVLAGVPRLAGLGHLSFYGDEETTAFPARALAEGRGTVMPSGMEYRRGLTVSWLAAGTAKLLGRDDEVSYRLPVALLGTLTVPLLFLFGRRFLGTGAALVAATALALSEWHLVHSRMARMYVPLLFFLLATGYATWAWAERGRLRELLLAAGVFAAAALTHSLAVLAVVFALIPIGLRTRSAVSGPKLASFAVVAAVAARIYDRVAVDAPFAARGTVPPPEGGVASPAASWPLEALAAPLGPWWLFAVAGAALGAWASARILKGGDDLDASLRGAGMILLAGSSGGLLAAGQPWGAGLLALLFLVVHEGERAEAVRRSALLLAPAAALGVACVAVDVASQGLAGGLREAVVFPFPYPLYLLREFPGVVLLFGGAAAWAALVPARSGRPELHGRAGLRAILLVTLAFLLAVGAARGWGHLRFLLPAYPFLLLVAAAALVEALRWAAGRLRRLPGWTGLAASLLVVVSGLLSGHGAGVAYQTATLRHGEAVDVDLHQQPFRPDHESAGEYVRSHRRAGDVVVAEDPLQQRWYAGPVDFWFRRLGDARQFLHVGADGGYRDNYVKSRLIAEPAVLDSIVRAAEGRVWMITSGETAHAREWYLDAEQRRWLDSLERAREPAYVARDSVTRVYCLNCGDGGRAAPGPG